MQLTTCLTEMLMSTCLMPSASWLTAHCSLQRPGWSRKSERLAIKVRRVSSSKRARHNVAGIVGISHVHLAYPCHMAEISKERGECSMLGARQRRRELLTL